MILYPTETIYGLGVNAFIEEEFKRLYELKGREIGKAVSVLVRDISDIEQYAYLGEVGRKLAEAFLPGPLTLVLRVRDEVPHHLVPEGTLGFRISSDPLAQKLISEFMEEYSAPLTCTSANLSGLPTLPTVPEILEQLGEKASMITKVIDGGERKGVASTVVGCIGDKVEIFREGAISSKSIMELIT